MEAAIEATVSNLPLYELPHPFVCLQAEYDSILTLEIIMISSLRDRGELSFSQSIAVVAGRLQRETGAS